MGYRTDLINKDITETSEKIEVIDSRYIFPNTMELYMDEISDLSSINNFKITDSEGKEYFRCSYFNEDDFIILNTLNEPLCNVISSNEILVKQEIYLGNNQNNFVTKIKTKESTVAEKYSVAFINKLTKKQEIFDINCDINYRVCGIFHGKEKNDSPLICKIIRNIYIANSYKITIAAGVDAPFVIALLYYFIKKSYKEHYKHQPAVIIKNYLHEIDNLNVESPNKIISIVDEKYVSQKPLIYKIEKLKKAISDNDFIIRDMNDTEIYYSKEILIGCFICSNENHEPLVSIKASSESDVKRKIYLGKKTDICIGSMKPLNSKVLKKYVLEFLNKDTNTNEQFIMNCDKDYFYSTILYDNGQGNTCIIAKIIKNQYNKRHYTIEIAPGVDSLYILGVALYFGYKSDMHYCGISLKNDYLNLIRNALNSGNNN